jgi:hypothetical protein
MATTMPKREVPIRQGLAAGGTAGAGQLLLGPPMGPVTK